ncbi:MATH domain and coiled-coil domain-containing protein At3g58210-like [Trifolium pratense]|uniref:MATH domain and coiled-coil domain-containing protein At3g58210-like n=1 Tax=Trifolium pratense TaxID=57577 RepID=UPI001E6925EE|nr:MATH domain and coiled-coil domain-containing protein At3g58210-like [Trifolium pratense]
MAIGNAGITNWFQKNITDPLLAILNREVGDMEHEHSSVENLSKKHSSVEKFTWKVEIFPFNRGIYSEPFVLGGYPWILYLYPIRSIKGDERLLIYLKAVQTANTFEGWSRDVKLKLSVYSQFNSSITITKESNYEFNASNTFWVFESFIDPKKGFIVKNAFIVGAEVYVCNSKNEKQVNQAVNFVSKSKLEEDGCQNVSELMDIKGLAQIDKSFAPLLEEACSLHPSLIECQQKRSRKFREWAFTALGRVLYFLKTRKVKDMSDLACKELQVLWEELQPFGFDLAWLEPRVQSAIGPKNYFEKLKEAEKLKDKVVSLELERQRLKSKIAIVEVNLDAARGLLILPPYHNIDHITQIM